ncbi:MAG: hydrogenase nickel incorporation protein HypB [Bacilli bacterium]
MDKNIRIIEIKKSVFAKNEIDADELRKKMKAQKTFLINIMSSPGSGKTTLLTALINQLKGRLKIGVMEADIDSDVDAKSIAMNTGVEAIQLHTGGMCHLDAQMTKQGLDNIEGKNLDLIFLENVGNLVCPAEFDTGASLNATILSVPEGDDKPLKYPLMYEVCNLVIISKLDTLPVFDFSIEKAEKNIHRRNPKAKIMFVSAKTGEGITELAEYLYETIHNWQGE